MPKKGPLGAGQFTQMEANFSFFFGLAVQLYEATLVSNDSRYDQFQEGRIALTAQEQNGMNSFTIRRQKCSNCHSGPLFSDATYPGGAIGAVEQITTAVGATFGDVGFHNISITSLNYDIGRGGNDPFGQPLSYSQLGLEKVNGNLPAYLTPYVPDLPCVAPCGVSQTAVGGGFKTPSLRNVELTGPYFHNGGAATLMQVVEFYTRGGNFPVANAANLDPDISPLGPLQGSLPNRQDIVAFLLTLTDERVRQEMAPFDHPQLYIPNGVDYTTGTGLDQMIELPAVGLGGRPAAGLPPLKSFLGLDPFQP